jgi:hypothetical protein
MVAKNGLDTERRWQATQNRKQIPLGFTVSFKNIAEQNDKVGLQRLDLLDPCFQPLLAEQ